MTQWPSPSPHLQEFLSTFATLDLRRIYPSRSSPRKTGIICSTKTYFCWKGPSNIHRYLFISIHYRFFNWWIFHWTNYISPAQHTQAQHRHRRHMAILPSSSSTALYCFLCLMSASRNQINIPDRGWKTSQPRTVGTYCHQNGNFSEWNCRTKHVSFIPWFWSLLLTLRSVDGQTLTGPLLLWGKTMGTLW